MHLIIQEELLCRHMENAKNKKQTESERAEAERVEAEAELEE